MKLVFPNGEHDQYELQPGTTTIGSDPGCQVVLTQGGIAKAHARIDIDAKGARIGVDDATNITRVNGSLVAARTPIKAGDALLFGTIQCQVVGQVPGVPSTAPAGANEPEASRTVVRMAVPRFILRGVSGSTFGKHFPIHGDTVIGRHSECDICLPADEISRKHARVQIEADGLYVEDMGSANGTFVNGKRVKKARLEPGDELKLDTVRFLIQAPGVETPPKPQDVTPTQESKVTEEDVEEAGSSSPVKWIVIAIVVIAAVGAGLKFGGIL